VWDIATGAGSIWATRTDGRLVRIDEKSGRVTATIAPQPVRLGDEVAFGGGFVWTGNDNESYAEGSTVSKINPATNRVVGRPLRLGSPQSITYGLGSVWVADHTGWIIKLDSRSFRVSHRSRLGFGPHGVVTGGSAVFVADSHRGRILRVDPKTAQVLMVKSLAIAPINPVFGDGALWSSSGANWETPGSGTDGRVFRIDQDSLALTHAIDVGAPVASVGWGFGSVWAASPSGSVYRVSLTSS
jgi:DNA-binding beta-propeller fold protein YncE